LGEAYCQEIINIVNVLAILKKIDDYAEKREKAAIANPEVINLDESSKALKARNFRKDLWKYAKDDQYPPHRLIHQSLRRTHPLYRNFFR